MRKKISYYKYWYKVHKELHEYYKELFESWMGELKFKNLKVEHLKNLLNEVEVLLDKGVSNNLIKQIIKNWKERDNIDTSIHNNLLFKK